MTSLIEGRTRFVVATIMQRPVNAPELATDAKLG